MHDGGRKRVEKEREMGQLCEGLNVESERSNSGLETMVECIGPDIGYNHNLEKLGPKKIKAHGSQANFDAEPTVKIVVAVEILNKTRHEKGEPKRWILEETTTLPHKDVKELMLVEETPNRLQGVVSNIMLNS